MYLGLMENVRLMNADDNKYPVFIHIHQPGAPTVHEGIKRRPAQGIDRADSSQSKHNPGRVKATAITEDLNLL